jgi:hypothetical protein
VLPWPQPALARVSDAYYTARPRFRHEPPKPRPLARFGASRPGARAREPARPQRRSGGPAARERVPGLASSGPGGTGVRAERGRGGHGPPLHAGRGRAGGSRKSVQGAAPRPRGAGPGGEPLWGPLLAVAPGPPGPKWPRAGSRPRWMARSPPERRPRPGPIGRHSSSRRFRWLRSSRPCSGTARRTRNRPTSCRPSCGRSRRSAVASKPCCAARASRRSCSSGSRPPSRTRRARWTR